MGRGFIASYSQYKFASVTPLQIASHYIKRKLHPGGYADLNQITQDFLLAFSFKKRFSFLGEPLLVLADHLAERFTYIPTAVIAYCRVANNEHCDNAVRRRAAERIYEHAGILPEAQKARAYMTANKTVTSIKLLAAINPDGVGKDNPETPMREHLLFVQQHGRTRREP